MKSVLIILSISVVFLKSSYAQDDPIAKYIQKQGATTSYRLNLNSNAYIRIFDGFLLNKDELKPNIDFNAINQTNDQALLKRIAATEDGKPVMFLNSEVSEVRKFIYGKARLDNYIITKGFNLPIILNDSLITFEKYGEVEMLDTNKIESIKFLKSPPGTISYKNKMPLGVIIVKTK